MIMVAVMAPTMVMVTMTTATKMRGVFLIAAKTAAVVKKTMMKMMLGAHP